MTAQHNPSAPVRLLIAENSENAAQEFDSLLRDAGIPTRSEIIDLPMAVDAMHEADILLANSSLPELEQFIPRLSSQAPNVPIVLVNYENATITTTRGLQLGAADVVPKSEPEHLVLVVKRELEHVLQYHSLSRTRRALEETEQRCQLLLRSSKAAIAYVHDGMHIYANEGYLNLFGFEDVEDLIGLPHMDLLDADSAVALKVAMKQFQRDGEEKEIEFVGQSTSEEAIEGTMTLAAAEYEGEHCMQVTVRTGKTSDSQGTVPGAGAVAGDASTANGDGSVPADVRLHAFFDAIAGNARSRPEDSFTAVFVAEIDDYAETQRSHGLAGALEVCREVEHCLGELIGTDVLHHLADHQFAFAVTADNEDEARAEADQLRGTVEGLLLEIREKTVRPTVTLAGVEITPEEDQDLRNCLESCLNQAYDVLRTFMDQNDGNSVELKTSGRGDEPESESARLLRLINEAIDDQRFVLLFQPMISLHGDSDEHYEVLLRMLDDEGNQMLPGDFLRTAIENNLAGRIDRWVILQAIKSLSAHRAKGNLTRLTINLTSNSVNDPEFLEWLGVAFKAVRLPTDAVVLQITEQDANTYVRQTREFVEKLKQMHCVASLSRFGRLANAFELLDHIPAEYVKVDGSLIEKVSSSSEAREKLTEMIHGLQGAGKLTVVPMVESANVLSTLWQAGANYVAGHYLQEPSTNMDYDFSADD
jgi:EAL domain-containing protein (putative c-di-GMP-specific phosphodiesterase class I)/PAS domain-containing protein/GGDEF domain-containing protein